MPYCYFELDDILTDLEPAQQLDVCRKALADASLALDANTKDQLTKRVSLLQVAQLRESAYPKAAKKGKKK